MTRKIEINQQSMIDR